MFLFLLTYFSIYGGIHLYAFLKARAALSPSGGFSVVLGSFMVVMVVAPIGVRLLERHGLHMVSRILAYVGFTWMGLIFIFFCLATCQDVFNLSTRLIALLLGANSSRFLWTGRNAFLLLTVGTFALGLWSFFSAWSIRLDRVSLVTTKLPAKMERFTIVQISDLHLGVMVGEKRLKRIIGLVQKAEPDLLICTGDLVDARLESLNHLAAMLAELRPPFGKFAITGNHEFYVGIDQSAGFFKAAGFTLLRNQSCRVENVLNMVGLDDPAVNRRGGGNVPLKQRESTLLAELDAAKYTLLLKHRPLVQTESLGRFDLQLSGHTHNGQIFPFTLLTRLYYPRLSGLYQLDRGSHLYVSRGSGTWGPPMRFLSPPQVTMIELVANQTGESK
jgi:predicted MPP superfamily phosphohydrolase